MFRERLRNMTEEERQIRFRNVGDPARSARFLSTYEHGVDSPYVLYAIAAFEKLFRTMDATLADGRDWLVADKLSLGDINLMPFVARLEYLNLLDLFRRSPAGQAWWQRVKISRATGKRSPICLPMKTPWPCRVWVKNSRAHPRAPPGTPCAI